jgi:hypothetical protein
VGRSVRGVDHRGGQFSKELGEIVIGVAIAATFQF